MTITPNIFKFLYGGNIINMNDFNKYRIFMCKYSCSHNVCINLCKDIYPFIKIKKKQIKLLFEVNKLNKIKMGCIKRSNDHINKLEELYLQCKKLNNRINKNRIEDKIKFYNNLDINENNIQLYHAYLAGILDADGYISIRRPGPNRNFYKEYIAINQIDYEAISILEKMFNVKSYLSDRSEIAFGKSICKPKYEFISSLQNSIKICKAIYPYIIEKKNQIDILFELRALINDVKINKTKVRMIDQEILYLKCKYLNNGGTIEGLNNIHI
jgi:glutaredoxin-related protein